MPQIGIYPLSFYQRLCRILFILYFFRVFSYPVQACIFAYSQYPSYCSSTVPFHIQLYCLSFYFFAIIPFLWFWRVYFSTNFTFIFLASGFCFSGFYLFFFVFTSFTFHTFYYITNYLFWHSRKIWNVARNSW